MIDVSKWAKPGSKWWFDGSKSSMVYDSLEFGSLEMLEFTLFVHENTDFIRVQTYHIHRYRHHQNRYYHYSLLDFLFSMV